MTPEFFQYLQPILVEEMKKEPGCKFIDFGKEAWSWENLYRLNTKVERSLVRTESDPVTYPLHLMVRDVERDIVNSYKDGTLAQKVADLPAEWNRRSKALLGVEAPDLAHGLLQDVHWSSGFIGYFPAYNGTIASAQMKDAMINRDHLDFGELVRTGQFKVFADWLKENVQKKASLYNGQEIMTQATGAPLGAKSFDLWKNSIKSMLIDPYTKAAAASHAGEDIGHAGP